MGSASTGAGMVTEAIESPRLFRSIPAATALSRAGLFVAVSLLAMLAACGEADCDAGWADCGLAESKLAFSCALQAAQGQGGGGRQWRPGGESSTWSWSPLHLA